VRTARAESVPKIAAAAPTKPKKKFRLFGGIARSLLTKLILLMLVFMTVPVILYSEFRQADSEKRRFLLESVRAQGRLIAESMRPLLAREDPSPLPDLNDALKPLAYDHGGIKILFRPASQHGLEDFFFVASEPPIPAATLAAERDRLIERGVLGKLAQSCQVQVPMALRHIMESGTEELLTSITPVTTKAGCWAVITTHMSSEMLGKAIDRPYWKTIEVRVAISIYVGMAIFVFTLFYSIWRSLLRFREMARSIGEGRNANSGFAEQNEVPELAEVAEEFDRMTGALRDSAESLRRAAEDNAHAFKTPIAIMRQSLAPLHRLIPDDNPRGKRALDVIEESVDRLDYLVASARRLDQATAELLDTPRERINLSRLVERMLSAYADSLASRNLTLAMSIEPEIVVRAGEDLLETVIENVIDNAVEISPSGGEIKVDLRRAKGGVVMIVRDRGPGVAPENLERIFDRYVSLRDRPKEEADAIGPHFGIGLWIVRRNLQAIGGQVWAENRPAGGLAVVMGLPLAH
jgi:two-component system sensor histidine kinase ChvG